MRNHWIVGVLGLLLITGGCAFLKEHFQNVKSGVSTPRTAEEQANGTPSVWEKGRQTAEPLKELPYGSFIFTPVALLLGLWYADRRGAALRTNQPVSSKPFTGALSNVGVGKFTFENLFQTIGNIVHGVSSVGHDGGSLSHGWQVSIATVAGLAAAALAIPSVKDFVVAHPQVDALLVGLIGLAGGIQKSLQNILPVAPPQPVVTPDA